MTNDDIVREIMMNQSGIVRDAENYKSAKEVGLKACEKKDDIFMNMIPESEYLIDCEASISLGSTDWREEDNACLAYMAGFKDALKFIKSKLLSNNK